MRISILEICFQDNDIVVPGKRTMFDNVQIVKTSFCTVFLRCIVLFDMFMYQMESNIAWRTYLSMSV